MKLIEAADVLPERLESDHFIIHYGLRNPRRGKGLARNGVRDPVLVQTYARSLETLYRTMKAPPWNRPDPVVGPSGKTRVYVLDLPSFDYPDPFTSVRLSAAGERVPFIALLCRSSEPTNESALRRAAAEAVHEGVHVFNYRERPYIDDLLASWWTWLDEGLAVHMEGAVLPGNQDYFRFLADWIDLPDRPLNDPGYHYQTCIFIYYLIEAVGRDFPNRLWTEAKPSEKPLEALERLLPDGRPFASADPDVVDHFASGYALDTYFLLDDGPVFAPDIRLRYGERALAESFLLLRNERSGTQGELAHLSNHYYRLYLDRQVDAVRVKLETKSSHLKAQLAVARRGLTRGRSLSLRSPQPVATNPHIELAGELGQLGDEDFDHLVVVVTNCEMKDVRREYSPHQHPKSRPVPYEISFETC